MLLAAATMTVALVVQGQTPLRAAAHENAPRQTTLTAGDWLEVRGEQHGFLQVYDHRHERPGYIRPSAVRSYVLDEAAAPTLGTLVTYVKDAPGEESLGIGFVALYFCARGARDSRGPGRLRRARNARGQARSSCVGTRGRGGRHALASELEVAESYGVHFASFEREGTTHVCYDGEAFRRVLALGGSPEQRVRAVLGLTDPMCVDPSLGATAALTLAKSRASVTDAVDVTTLAAVPGDEQARVRIRRSMVQAELAYFAARGGDAELAKQAGAAAKHDLQLADRNVLADEDRPAPRRPRSVPRRCAGHARARACARFSPGSRSRSPGRGPGADVHPREERRARDRAVRALHVRGRVAVVGAHRSARRGGGRRGGADGRVERAARDAPGEGAAWASDTMSPGLVDPELGYAELAGVLGRRGRISSPSVSGGRADLSARRTRWRPG